MSEEKGKKIVHKTETSDMMASPYYLSSSDNPGALICPVLLNGENYGEWSSELENSLRAKRKTGFINGSLPMPSEVEKPVEAEQWRTVNCMIVGWIRTSMTPQIRSAVPFTNDAAQLWTNLKRRFCVSNTVRVHQLKAEISACKQQGSSVMEYFGRLSSKWEELQSSKKTIKCTCSAAEEYSRDQEEEKVHQFLMGLDDARFGNVCAIIIGLDPLPDLNTTYQRVVREEHRLDVTRQELKSDVIGFVAKAEGEEKNEIMAASVKTSSFGITCSHCGRSGHEKSDCWQIVGFPEWFNERGTRGGRGRGGTNRGRGRGRTNQATAHQASASGVNLPNFTAEQWTSLTKLLEERKSTPLPDKLHGNVQTSDVVLDTGASHHMT